MRWGGELRGGKGGGRGRKGGKGGRRGVGDGREKRERKRKNNNNKNKKPCFLPPDCPIFTQLFSQPSQNVLKDNKMKKSIDFYYLKLKSKENNQKIVERANKKKK